MSKFTVRRVVFAVLTLVLLVAAVWVLRTPDTEVRASEDVAPASSSGLVHPEWYRFDAATGRVVPGPGAPDYNACTQDAAARCDLSTVLPGGARFNLSLVPAVGYTCGDGWMARTVTVYVNWAGTAVAQVSQVACAPVGDSMGGGVAEVLPAMFRKSAELYW